MPFAVLARLSAVDSAPAQADAMWQGADWGEAVAPDADLMWRRLDTGGIPWAPYAL